MVRSMSVLRRGLLLRESRVVDRGWDPAPQKRELSRRSVPALRQVGIQPPVHRSVMAHVAGWPTYWASPTSASCQGFQILIAAVVH